MYFMGIIKHNSNILKYSSVHTKDSGTVKCLLILDIKSQRTLVTYFRFFGSLSPEVSKLHRVCVITMYQIR